MHRARLALPLVAAVIALTAPRLVWHIDFFAAIDPVYRLVLLASFAALIAAGFLLHWSRTKREPAWALWLIGAAVFVREPRAVFVVAAAAVASYALGGLLTRLLRLPAATPSVRITLGQAAYTVILAALGFAGQLRPLVAWVLLAPAAFGVLSLRLPRTKPIARTPVTSIAWLGAIVSAAVGAAFALTPCWQGDPVRLHLMLARVYEQQGSLAAPPFQPYAWFPQAFEVMLTWMNLLGGPAAGQLLAPLQFLLLLVMAFSLARRCGLDREAAFTGCTLGAALPFLHYTAFTPKNDVAMAQYQLAALLTAIEALAAGAATGWIGAGAFLLGASAGVKHTALFGALPLGALLTWAAWRSPRRRTALALLLLLALPAGAFWHLRTWQAKGDPGFPRAARAAVSSGAQEPGLAAKVARYAELPWSLHFRGRRHFESPSDNSLGVTLLLAAALLLGRHPRRWPAAMWATGFFVLASLVYWASVLSVLRYALLPLLLLCVLAARSWTGPAGALAAAWALLFAWPVTTMQEFHPATPRYLTGSLTRDEFLSSALPSHAAARSLAAVAGPRDAILSVGAWALAYFPFPAAVDEVFRNDRNFGPEDLAPLSQRPYRFLVLPEAPNTAALEKAARQFARLKPLYRDHWFRVYELAGLE